MAPYGMTGKRLLIMAGADGRLSEDGSTSNLLPAMPTEDWKCLLSGPIMHFGISGRREMAGVTGLSWEVGLTEWLPRTMRTDDWKCLREDRMAPYGISGKRLPITVGADGHPSEDGSIY